MSKPREVYPVIHIVSCAEKSDCPYYTLIKYGEVAGEECIAQCKVTSRYLTRSFIRKCIAFWQSCPFKQIMDSQQA